MATTSGRSSFPAVGFSLSCLKPKTLCRYQVNTAFLFNTSKRPNFVVRCEKKDKDTDSDSDNKRKSKNLARVPLDQRWMFEESELNGPDIWNKTWYPKAADHVPTDKPWYVVDATDKILGRLASTIAIYVRGKNLATYTPSVDMGAFVIVVCGLFSNACMFVLLPYQADRA